VPQKKNKRTRVKPRCRVRHPGTVRRPESPTIFLAVFLTCARPNASKLGPAQFGFSQQIPNIGPRDSATCCRKTNPLKFSIKASVISHRKKTPCGRPCSHLITPVPPQTQGLVKPFPLWQSSPLPRQALAQTPKCAKPPPMFEGVCALTCVFQSLIDLVAVRAGCRQVVLSLPAFHDFHSNSNTARSMPDIVSLFDLAAFKDVLKSCVSVLQQPTRVGSEFLGGPVTSMFM